MPILDIDMFSPTWIMTVEFVVKLKNVSYIMLIVWPEYVVRLCLKHKLMVIQYEQCVEVIFKLKNYIQYGQI